ncbi:uncharacterized protein LOC110860770 [Folsomia candida]|uniref:uncharacterized protein LOC110860770 n=1 Tax=Folsomia candida TaxID=158441 RepID=UPI000B8F89C2|nr:uncharacterized protein LOC110860770 [Folsomia candida]
MESQGKINAQQIALNNPIILSEILKQSSAPLKNCRLVSHFWNKVVLSLPNTRLVLNLNSKDEYEKDPFPFFELCYTLDDRLAKRISAHTDPISRDVTYAFSAKLMHLGLRFSDRIQILDMRIYFEHGLKPIFQVLKNSCPNLKQLRIRCGYRVDKHGVIPDGEVPLPQKPNLTVFELRSTTGTPSPTLTTFTQLVVNASPNLRKVTLPLGFYPDLETLKFIDSLTLEVDSFRQLDVALTDFKPSDLTRMVGQVGGQLVHLAFCYFYADGRYGASNDRDLNNSTQSGFHLPEKMSKLRTFKNDMVDIVHHADLWEDVKGMPAMEMLKLGKISKRSKSVDTILKNRPETERISTSVTDLRIHELHDPGLLEGFKTAFPNLKTLWVDNKEAGMKLGVVLKACMGWSGLNHLHIRLPTYAKKTWDIIKPLLDSMELYKELKSLEIKVGILCGTI